MMCADALAWLGLKHEVKGWRKWAMILWFAAAGIALSLLPERWVGAQGDAKHWILFAVAFGGRLGFWQLLCLSNGRGMPAV